MDPVEDQIDVMMVVVVGIVSLIAQTEWDRDLQMAILAQHSLIHVVKIGGASQMKGCSKRQTIYKTHTHTHIQNNYNNR